MSKIIYSAVTLSKEKQVNEWIEKNYTNIKKAREKLLSEG